MTRTLLLDSRAFLWAAGAPERLSPVDCAALQASALPVSAVHLYRAFSVEGLHKDPFDRLLIAQAQSEGLVLGTRDRSVQRYPVETIW